MTEETNTSSEQEQENEETSNSTEEKSPASEPVVPLHEHTALRSRAQAAEVEAANYKGQLTALQSQTAEQTVKKSPMDIEIARQIEDGIDEEDMTITPALYRQQQVFEKQQAEQASIAETTTVRQTAQLASTELAKVAHDDWQEVVTAAFKHMTKGEILDIESEKDNFGEVAYAKAQQVLERVKPVKTTAPETELSKSEAEAKVKADAEAKTKADAKKVPSQDEVLKSDNPRISHVMNL